MTITQNPFADPSTKLLHCFFVFFLKHHAKYSRHAVHINRRNLQTTARHSPVVCARPRVLISNQQILPVSAGLKSGQVLLLPI